MDWIDDGIDDLIMPADDFYDMIFRYQKGLIDGIEKQLVFDSNSGKIYVASSTPGRYLRMKTYMPIFIGGQYRGIGEFEQDFTIKKIHPGLQIDGFGEGDIGMVARISVLGDTKKWKFKGVEYVKMGRIVGS